MLLLCVFVCDCVLLSCVKVSCHRFVVSPCCVCLCVCVFVCQCDMVMVCACVFVWFRVFMCDCVYRCGVGMS